MGNTLPVQQQRVDQLPRTSQWVLVSKHTFRRYRNRFTKHQFQEYTFMPSGQLTYAQQLAHYQFRKTQQFNLVSTQYFQRISKNNMCSGHEFYKVWVEYIPHRATEFRNLSLSQLVFVLKECIIGFKKIVEMFGEVSVSAGMIGVNKQGKVRVWLSENFQDNLPSQMETTKLQRMKVGRGVNLEYQMVSELIKIAGKMGQERGYPERLKSRLDQVDGKVGLEELERIVNTYVVQQNIVQINQLYEQILNGQYQNTESLQQISPKTFVKIYSPSKHKFISSHSNNELQPNPHIKLNHPFKNQQFNNLNNVFSKNAARNLKQIIKQQFNAKDSIDYSNIKIKTNKNSGQTQLSRFSLSQASQYLPKWQHEDRGLRNNRSQERVGIYHSKFIIRNDPRSSSLQSAYWQKLPNTRQNSSFFKNQSIIRNEDQPVKKPQKQTLNAPLKIKNALKNMLLTIEDFKNTSVKQNEKHSAEELDSILSWINKP